MRIVSLLASMVGVLCVGGPAWAQEAEPHELAASAYAVFETHCAACHAHGERDGGFGEVLNLDAMVADDFLVVPGEPDESEVYLMMAYSQMPPPAAGLPEVQPTEIEAVRAWIAAGAPTALAERGQAVQPEPETETQSDAGPQSEAEPAESDDVQTSDEATSAGMSPWMQRTMRWLGKLHPLSVHVPIAMVFGALLAELMMLVFGSRSMAVVVRFCLWVALLGGLVAGGLGWIHGEHQVLSSRRQNVMEWHRWLAVAAVATTGLAAGLAELRAHVRWTWVPPGVRLVLVLAAVLVSLTGYFGGSLVFGGLDHLAW